MERVNICWLGLVEMCMLNLPQCFKKGNTEKKTFSQHRVSVIG
jgi:hypothetical protein